MNKQNSAFLPLAATHAPWGGEYQPMSFGGKNMKRGREKGAKRKKGERTRKTGKRKRENGK